MYSALPCSFDGRWLQHSSSCCKVVKMLSSWRRLSSLSIRNCRLSSSSAKENGAFLKVVKIANEWKDPEGSISTRFAKAMWKLCFQRKYSLVAEAYDSLGWHDKEMSTTTQHAAMFANGSLRKSYMVKWIVEQTPSEKLSPQTLSYLMEAYTLDDRLGSAERLLWQWLLAYLKHYPSDQETREIVAQLENSPSIKEASNTTTTPQIDVVRGTVGEEPVPLGVWVGVIAMYARRGAWQHCWTLLAYLEKVHSKYSAYSFDMTPEAASSIIRRLGVLTRPSFKQTTLFQTSDALLLDQGPSYDGNTLTALQWSSIYHTTLHALADAEQFPLALHLLKRMQRAGSCDGNTSTWPADCALAAAQVPATLSLLRLFTCPIPAAAPAPVANPPTPAAVAAEAASTAPVEQLAHVVHSLAAEGKVPAQLPDAMDAFQTSLRLRRHLVVSLGPDVSAWLKSQAVPITGGHTAKGWVRNERIIATLARNYLMALCRLDLMPEAKAFVTDILQHVLDQKFPAGRVAGDPGRAVAGFQTLVWINPYLTRLRDNGDVEGADALSKQLDEIQEYERRTLRDAIKRTGDKQLKQRLQVLENPTVALNLYHETAASLRRAGQYTELADLVYRTPSKL